MTRSLIGPERARRIVAHYEAAQSLRKVAGTEGLGIATVREIVQGRHPACPQLMRRVASALEPRLHGRLLGVRLDGGALVELEEPDVRSLARHLPALPAYRGMPVEYFEGLDRSEVIG